MTEWLGWLRDIAAHQPAALVSILATEGSAPRGAGTRMLVTTHGQFGTIGGGQLEHRAIDQARAILGHPSGNWRVQDYPLGPLLGQCCGGRVRLLVEHVDPVSLGWLDNAHDDARLTATLTADAVVRGVDTGVATVSLSARGERPGIDAVFAEAASGYRRPLFLFGAGHVGQAIAKHAANLPFRLAWFDTRPAFAEIEAVTLVDTAQVEACVNDAPADAAIVILTHDHALDYRLTRAALLRQPVAFVGLIGSATKKARFLRRLERDGVEPIGRSRLTSPIGIAGIIGKEPDVIAIATLAQLLQLPRE